MQIIYAFENIFLLAVENKILLQYFILSHSYLFQHWITEKKTADFHPSHNLHLDFDMGFSFW